MVVVLLTAIVLLLMLNLVALVCRWLDGKSRRDGEV